MKVKEKNTIDHRGQNIFNSTCLHIQSLRFPIQVLKYQLYAHKQKKVLKYLLTASRTIQQLIDQTLGRNSYRLIEPISYVNIKTWMKYTCSGLVLLQPRRATRPHLSGRFNSSYMGALLRPRQGDQIFLLLGPKIFSRVPNLVFWLKIRPISTLISPWRLLLTSK